MGEGAWALVSDRRECESELRHLLPAPCLSLTFTSKSENLSLHPAFLTCLPRPGGDFAAQMKEHSRERGRGREKEEEFEIIFKHVKRYPATTQPVKVSHKKHVGKRSPTGRSKYNMMPHTGHPKKGRYRLYRLGVHIRAIKPRRKARERLSQASAHP